MAPKSGDRTASSIPWLKMVPRAIAEGLTGGRSGGDWSVLQAPHIDQVKEMSYEALDGLRAAEIALELLSMAVTNCLKVTSLMPDFGGNS